MTRTPWKFDDKGDVIGTFGDKVLVNGLTLPLGNHPLAKEADDNTAFIVRAVNSHEELISACKFMAAQIERLAEHAFSEHWESWLENCDALNAGKQAIAKAEGR